MATKNTGNARRYELDRRTVTTTNGSVTSDTIITYTMLPASNGKVNPNGYTPIASQAALKSMSSFDYKSKVAEFMNALANVPNTSDLYNSSEFASASCQV